MLIGENEKMKKKRMKVRFPYRNRKRELHWTGTLDAADGADDDGVGREEDDDRPADWLNG